MRLIGPILACIVSGGPGANFSSLSPKISRICNWSKLSTLFNATCQLDLEANDLILLIMPADQRKLLWSASLRLSDNVDFFTATIRNRNTRQAYARACWHFFDWCAAHGLELTTVRPFHVAAWIED